MPKEAKTIKPNLVYPELSYKIIGALFEVYNELGSGYQEKYYQKATAALFRNLGLNFKEQPWSPLIFKNTKIGDYYFDFLVDDKIVLELKRKERFSRRDIEQVFAYLKVRKLKLGILAYFTNSGVRFKRILNLSK